MITGQERSDNLIFISSPGIPEREIMNLRLTCRRFSDCSSHLLLRHISVEFNMKSLSHLEEVSRHPTIRRGIRGVQFRMSFYSSLMANDIYKFAEHKIGQLRGQMQRMPSAFIYRHLKPKKIQESIRIGSSIVRTWENFAGGGSTNDEAGLILLRQCHADYKRLFTVQEEMRCNGTYTRLVTAALAMLPNAKIFQVCDSDPQMPFFHTADKNTDIIQTLNTPNGWEESKLSKLGDPPTEFLLQLPVILAGVTDCSLNYQIVWEHYPSIPAPSSEVFQSIKVAAKNLKSLRYFRGRHQFTTNDPLPNNFEEAYALKKILNALLSSEIIEEILINFSFFLDDGCLPLTTSLYPFVFPRNFPKLQILALCDFTVHLAELREMLGSSNPSLVSVSLTKPFLLSGTWREGLEIIRRASLKERNLNNPAGAECIGMPEEEYKYIFLCHFREMQSIAEDFIRGSVKYNPLTRR